MNLTSAKRWIRTACAVFIPLLCARGAQAQYFGQNHVQYRTFDFQVMRTEHFDVYFYADEAVAAQAAARMAERWYVRLATILQDSLSSRQPLILYAAAAHFRQTNVVSGIGEGTGGVTESFKRRIVLPFGASLEESDHVLGHELVHAFQYDIGGRRPGGASGGALSLPLWFIEGMAEYLSLGPVDPHTSMWMRDAAQRNDLPAIRELDHPRFFPYRYGQAFWAYVGGRFGDETIANMLRVASQTRDPMTAIRNVLQQDPDSLSAAWHAALRAAYGEPAPDRSPLVVSAPGGAGAPTALFTRQTTGGDLNVGPSLSPDGSRIVFLSERSRFSIDLYLADATSGRIIRKVTQTAMNPHLESLQFIYSAGAWHPDGQRFAVAAQSRGRPELQIYDLNSGRTEREIPLRTLDEIFNPSWSPDGQRVVFTGQLGGMTDLYIYNMGDGELVRLTNDAFADLQPAWSPDGRGIAFVTDRFTTNAATLAYGRYRLARLDVATGRIEALPGFSAGKQINPQWSRDGGSLFFLADPDGVTNVYRLDVATGTRYRLTDLATGASGIAALSPALTVAGDRLAVSVHRDGGAEIYRVDGSALEGRPVDDVGGNERAAMLPPRDRPASRVMGYLADDRTGLPSASGFSEERYRESFGLDYIAQPSLAVGTSRYGTFFGGGVSLYFSSMLGNRQLATMLQVNGGLKDVAAGVQYVNLARRIDWAVAVSQVPYLTGGYSRGQGTVNGQPVIIEQQVIQRQTNRQAEIMGQYPFNRAQRAELAVGARYITFETEVREVYFDQFGTPIGEQRTELPSGEALTLGDASASLVYDNSIFGGTGPIMGQRWRLEAAPTVGSLNFVGALADFRKYVPMSRGVTLAGRLMHYGRYGSGGDDPRLSPLFLGYQSLVRGYDNGSFHPLECRNATPTDDCPVFNQLLGSRMLVGNAELRVGLLGPFGLAARSFLPLDLALFADGGVAWNSSETPEVFGGSQPAVGSVGAGLRFNLLGFAIAEVDFVKPLNRPDKGWYVQFGFNPGF